MRKTICEKTDFLHLLSELLLPSEEIHRSYNNNQSEPGGGVLVLSINVLAAKNSNGGETT